MQHPLTRFPTRGASRRCWSRLAPTLIGAMAMAATARAQVSLPLDVVEDGDGITVQTQDWKVVFERRFNGGASRWFDLASDPTELDNLAAEQGTGTYTQGVLFDYDVYLGTHGGNAIEYMTTMGASTATGELELSVLEASPARVRILQHGHPRLNNGGGPPGDPFRELDLVTFDTIWSLYPTGRVNIDFQTAIEASGMVVDSGPGAPAKSISAAGTTVTASDGTDFLTSGVWAGDTIESAAGAWGPITVSARTSATTLQLNQAVPSGSGLDFVVRRSNIAMETISIHADGDPSIVQQCSDPATSNWRGGSNGDPLWNVATFSACKDVMRNQGSGYPPLASDTLLVHWARQRGAGSLLSFYEPWSEATFGAFNDRGFTDISYTQLGRFGVRPAQPVHRHFLAQIGSTASPRLPSLQSVAQALPYSLDYRAPHLEVLRGTLATGPEVAAYGFNLSRGAYAVAAATCTPAATCREAIVRLDGGSGGRAGAIYLAPAIELDGFGWNLPAGDGDVRVELSNDDGTSYAPLDPALFNLTSSGDEASLGAGRRLFQHLGSLSGSGNFAPLLRFRSTSQCTATPRPSCRTSNRGSLLLGPATNPAHSTLRWLWSGGVALTDVSEFGNPRLDADTSLCIYAGAGQSLVLEASVAAGDQRAGRPAWAATSTGFRYRRPGSNRDGIRSLVLRAGAAGTSKIALRGSGGDLGLPALPLDVGPGVVAQLANSDSNTCWQTAFSGPALRENSLLRLRAAIP